MGWSLNVFLFLIIQSVGGKKKKKKEKESHYANI